MLPKGRRWVFAASLCVIGLTAGTEALSQTKKAVPAAQPAAARYAIPGSADSASAGRKGPGGADGRSKKGRQRQGDFAPRPGAPVATFPGFRLLPDGRSRVYVELTKTVSVEERRAPSVLTYMLHGAQVLVRNNKNALITTHFATPVARARLVSAGEDLLLVIELRAGVDPTHQVVAGENGAARLEIDFPAGNYPVVAGREGPPGEGSARGRGRARPAETDDATDAPEGEPEEPPQPPRANTPSAGPPAP